jgi:small-conductance mechanosensitive channel
VFKLVGPSESVQLFGVRLLGVDAENGRKLLLMGTCFALLFILSKFLRALARRTLGERGRRAYFWTHQGTSLVLFLLGVVAFLSIWFDNPGRLATGVGLLGAGLAFALQKVVTSFAGYFVILRGKTFDIGDRITMGGVRGDVISLNFLQTSIMEMGEPPSVQSSDPGMWVQSRQFSGRIVTVSNSQIFEEPVYNYTRDFPFIWEELHLPISYKDDRALVERILLRAAEKETLKVESLAAPAVALLEQKYFITRADIQPRVYMRLTDNWLELTVRFLCSDHDVRGVKDRMSREIIQALDEAKIAIASATYEIVGLPPVRIAGAEAIASDKKP